MSGSTILDLVLLVAVLGRAIYGLRTGLLAGSFSLIGMAAGAWAGMWAGPQLVAMLPQVDANRLARSIALVALVFVGVTLGELLIGAIGRRIRGKDRASGLDAILGMISAALVVALLAWGLLTAVRPVAPPALGTAIDDSVGYQVLDRAVPDRFHELPGRAMDAIVSRLPEVFGGDEPVLPIPEPDNDSINTPEVQAAAASIVQIRTDAPSCVTDSTGSGWVVAPQRVVTNAHVVAGSEQVTVRIGGKGAALAAQVVGFDPDLDLAILAVPELAAAPLPRAPSMVAGEDAIAAGFPWGGPYTLSATRIRGTVTENGTDIFGEAGIPREVYAVRGTLRPGNSGGPLLTPDGRVAGTIFATSLVDPQTGYVLTDAATAGWLDTAAGLADPVPTGGCLSR